ncbi:MAG: radical SAM protein [Thermodesulfobacteriota bacterium]
MSTVNPRSILLIHPLGYNAELAGKDISRKANIMPPLGLASIGAYLEERDIRVTIIDCYAHPDSMKRIQTILAEEKPAWIGFSCTTSSFLDGVAITEQAKSILPRIRSVFGGPHVSALKEVLLTDYPPVDFLVVGEGEETLYQLMTEEEDTIESIEGLVYRDSDSQPVFSGYRKKLLELDELPFPAYEKLEGYPEFYQLPIFNYPKAPNTSMISSRGCPYACSYCDRSVFRRSFRYNSAEYLFRHVVYLREKFNIRHINFYDDQFTFNRDRVEEFCDLMIKSPLKITFNCAVRGDHIDLELLQLMKKAGCWMISLGIETGDENLLNQHKHKGNLKLLSEKIYLIKKAGIRVKGLMMIGLPGETERTVKKSMEYVFSHPIDDINLAKFTPFPGSPLYQNIHDLGEFDEDWKKMDCMHFLFVPRGMTRERLEELFADYYRGHFSRNKVLWGYVTMLWKSPHSWYRFIRDLGHFLSFVKSSKRIAEQPTSEKP